MQVQGLVHVQLNVLAAKLLLLPLQLSLFLDQLLDTHLHSYVHNPTAFIQTIACMIATP